MGRQPPEWEKIFSNCIYDKGLISKIYAEHIQLERKKKKKAKQNYKTTKKNKTQNQYNLIMSRGYK